MALVEPAPSILESNLTARFLRPRLAAVTGYRCYEDLPDELDLLRETVVQVSFSRDRVVKFAANRRAWVEEVWRAKVVTPDTSGVTQRVASNAIDASLEGISYAPGPDGSLIVSAERLAQIRYKEPKMPIWHRGGEYRLLIQAPRGPALSP